MSRVIKAARVQFEGFGLTHGAMGPISSGSDLIRGIDLEQMEIQVRERLEMAENKASEMLAKAEQDAKLILSRAEEQARQYKQTVEQEACIRAEETRALAYQYGYQEGIEQGLEEGRRQAAGSLEAASRALLEAQDKAKQSLLQEDVAIVELAVALARRVIGQELSVLPQVVVSMAHQVLAKLEDTPHAVLRVSAEILPLYRERLEGVKADLKQLIGLEIMADPLLSAGDFLIDTPNGTVDGRLDAQLDVLRKSLLNLYHERAGLHA